MILGLADQLRHIEPVEAPALIDRDEIGKVARLVPVVHLDGVALELGGPVDELVAFAVDVVDDRIDHDLAGEDRADAQIAAPGEDRLVPRHAAPGVDAGEHHAVADQLLAQRRVDAVAGDHDAGRDRRQRLPARRLLEQDARAALVLLDADAETIGHDALRRRAAPARRDTARDAACRDGCRLPDTDSPPPCRAARGR